MDDLEYRLQTTTDGQQALVAGIPGLFQMQIMPDGHDIASSEILHVTQAEYELLASKAMTNKINIDTINSTMTLKPMPTNKRKQVTNE